MSHARAWEAKTEEVGMIEVIQSEFARLESESDRGFKGDNAP